MARIDEAPEDRDKGRLQIDRLLDCAECGSTFDHLFTCPPGVTEVEDIIDAPVEEVECPDCGHKWQAECELWLSHEDAG